VKSTDFTALVLLMTSIGQSQTLTTSQARSHDGDKATVCGIVGNEYSATNSQGKPTFIDLDSAFPNQVFAILVWEEDRQKVGPLPRTGEHVCATGTINYYHGVPQIVVRSSAQFSR
jgi:hypothetical protein